jgi:hypothetical protein
MKLLVFEQRVFWNELGGVVAWESQVRAALQERERLRAVPLFSEATPRQLDLLAVKLVVQPFQRGEPLMRQGDRGDAFYIVREGQVDVLARENGRSRRLSVLGPGEYFGEIALLRDQPRMATVKGKTDGSVWRLERQDFRDLWVAISTSTRNSSASRMREFRVAMRFGVPPDAMLDLRRPREWNLPVLRTRRLPAGCQAAGVRPRGLPGGWDALRPRGRGRPLLRRLQTEVRAGPHGVS